MIKKKQLIIPSILITLVFFLGCAQEEKKGVGLSIDSFEADTTSLRPGDEFTVNTKITNQGDVVAEKIYGEILNTADLQISGESKKTVSKLSPEEDTEFSWVMRVPEDLSISSNYKPKMRLCYVYKTNAYHDLFVAGDSWEGDLPELQSGSSRGAVDLSFEVPNLYEEKQSSYFKVNVHNDESKGFAANNTISESHYGDPGYVKRVVVTIPKMDGRINLQGIDQPHFNCLEDDMEYTCTATDVRLIGGVDKNLKAVFNVVSKDDFDEASGRLSAYVVYRYCTDSNQITLTAQPRR